MAEQPGAYCICGHHFDTHRGDSFPTVCFDPHCGCQYFALNYVLNPDGTCEMAEQIVARHKASEPTATQR